MRRIATAVLMLMGSFGATLVYASPASAASSLTCTSYQWGGTFSSVYVPPGADCTLDGVTVKGDVTVRDASNFDTFNGKINGNLFVQGQTGSNHTLEVCGTPIGKSVDVAGADDFALEADPNEGCNGPVKVGGSVNVHDNEFVEISWQKIAGNLTAGHNGEVELENNTIVGNRTCGNNGFLDINDEPDNVKGADNCTS